MPAGNKTYHSEGPPPTREGFSLPGTKSRDQSLDALRGFAILTMVLSGSIAYGGVLPSWMYHAQVPPPMHKFVPTIPGITWVDLVFPFFLFSMGAAIPLSLSRLEREGAGLFKVMYHAGRRYALLVFFALFTFHMRAWVIAESPGVGSYLLSVLGFVLLCFQYYDYKGEKYRRLFITVKLLAFAVSVFLLWSLPFNKGEGFRWDKSDIIIIVLGNMAFFGTITWWLTRDSPIIRIGLLAFVMAIFLGGKEAGSWNEAVFNFSPVPWMYKFYYLKYLFIILPGTLAGEWLSKRGSKKMEGVYGTADGVASILAFGLVILNVALLFKRELELNLLFSCVLLALLYGKLQKLDADNHLRKFYLAGCYLLLLGLFFEAYEGGVKKDSSTYSYYFITTGLAFFMLIGLQGMETLKAGRGVNNYLSLNGRNPMVAYVAGSLLLLPLLNLTGAIRFFDLLNSNAWVGFFRGVLFTAIVSFITIFFTRRGWLWKT